MVKRKRNKIENLFNLNRYRKRAGAKEIEAHLEKVNYETLKNTIIPGEKPDMFQSHMFKDLKEHMAHLKTAFNGQPEILFYHAQLIVLLRREADTARNYQLFKQLWLAEQDFLLEHLNMRWLIAAIDTFIDHDPSIAVRSILLNAVVLINTIKLYETERHLLKVDDTDGTDYDSERLVPTRKNCFNLFDELPSFRIGIDDTLRNMRWRIDEVGKADPFAYKILINVFDRVNERGSVYTRFRACHEKPRNAWWSE